MPAVYWYMVWYMVHVLHCTAVLVHAWHMQCMYITCMLSAYNYAGYMD
jgi:hypothetical protein